MVTVDQAIAKAHLEAAGWEMNEHNHGNPFSSHIVYVFDQRTHKVELFLLTEADLMVQPPSMSAGEAATVLAEALLRRNEGRMTEREEAVFPAMIVTYIKATVAYGQWCRRAGAKDRLHFLINVYKAPGRDGYVRPFIAPRGGIVIPARTAVEYSGQIEDMDRHNHPEWFMR